MIGQLLDQLSAELNHSRRGISKLDLINRPARPSGDITSNRRQVFKEFNYRFHS